MKENSMLEEVSIEKMLHSTANRDSRLTDLECDEDYYIG